MSAPTKSDPGYSRLQGRTSLDFSFWNTFLNNVFMGTMHIEKTTTVTEWWPNESVRLVQYLFRIGSALNR